MRPWLVERATLVALALLVVGCAASNAGVTSTTVDVTLSDHDITLGSASVASGPVSFSIRNDGTVVHELEIIEGDGTEITVSQGVADLSRVTVVDEIEDIVPGVTVGLEVDLSPGVYTLLCNYPEHYEMGMATTITVTG